MNGSSEYTAGLSRAASMLSSPRQFAAIEAAVGLGIHCRKGRVPLDASAWKAWLPIAGVSVEGL